MIRIFGWSDDLVEIEGSKKEREIDAYDKDVLITFTDGTMIRVGYCKPGLGIWYILIELKGTATQKLDICENQDDGAYSDVFFIDAEIVSYHFDKQKGREMWLNPILQAAQSQQEVIIYDKLVRDRIPEIIQASGDTCDIEILSSEKYLEKLEEKLYEEVKEYHESGSIEEIADILEVLYAIASARGCSSLELEEVRRKKASEKGAFNHRILLKAVLKEKKEGKEND